MRRCILFKGYKTKLSTFLPNMESGAANKIFPFGENVAAIKKPRRYINL